MRQQKAFFETICAMDGEVRHLAWHQKRIDRTLEALGASRPKDFDLERHLAEIEPPPGRCRIRVDWYLDDTGPHWDEAGPLAVPYAVRPVREVLILDLDTLPWEISYEFKWKDRACLERLPEGLTLEPGQEIVYSRNGCLVEGRYANLVARTADGRHVMPRHPLHRGTTMDRLLHEGKAVCGDLALDQLDAFHWIGFVNAMLEPGDLCVAPGHLFVHDSRRPGNSVS